MAGTSTGQAGPSDKEPGKGSPEGAPDLSKAAGPRMMREAATHSVAITNLSGPQFEKLAQHAQARGMDLKEAARAILIEGLDRPIEESVARQRDALGASQRKVHLITVDVEVTRGKPKEKRTYVQIQLSAEQQEYVHVWKAMLHGLTDRFHISTFPPVEGQIPLCFYKDSPYDLLKYFAKTKITEDLKSLPRLKSDTLDLLSPIDREQGAKLPVVVGLPPDRVARLIRWSQPTFKEISEQLAAAKAQNVGGISGIAMNIEQSPSLSEQELVIIGRLSKSCEVLARSSR